MGGGTPLVPVTGTQTLDIRVQAQTPRARATHTRMRLWYRVKSGLPWAQSCTPVHTHTHARPLLPAGCVCVWELASCTRGSRDV